MKKDKTSRKSTYNNSSQTHYSLGYENIRMTFIKTNGEECSELDYFLHKSRHMQVADKEVLKDVISNHSDHDQLDVDTIAESPAETAEDVNLLISKMHQMLTKAAIESSSKKSRYKAKPKLKVWTPIIKSSLKEMRKCYDVWNRNGKPTNPADKSYQDRINTGKEFKKQVKVEQARERDREKQEILEARTRDSKLYHKLVKRVGTETGPV
ncbi:IK [Mytilus coruscus]|uniref:IK n=1 Tax=Mytilus coruscus TaxID=42192 RepID=A0A6J8CTP9_MYTCO|nr:IK [Mytilus coruscus]